MKPSRFTEEQIIGIFAGAGGRGKDGRRVPQARHQQRDVLQMESQVRRSGSVGRQAPEGSGRRERQAQEAAC